MDFRSSAMCWTLSFLCFTAAVGGLVATCIECQELQDSLNKQLCPSSSQKCPDYLDGNVEIVDYRGPCLNSSSSSVNSYCTRLGCTQRQCLKGTTTCDINSTFATMECVNTENPGWCSANDGYMFAFITCIVLSGLTFMAFVVSTVSCYKRFRCVVEPLGEITKD